MLPGSGSIGMQIAHATEMKKYKGREEKSLRAAVLSPLYCSRCNVSVKFHISSPLDEQFW